MGFRPQVSQDTKATVRSAAVLTTSYVAASVELDLQNWNQLVLLLDFTKGASTGFTIKLEFSDKDRLDWFQETAIGSSTIAANIATTPVYQNEYTFSETGKYALPVPVNYRYVRISSKALTAAGGTVLAIYATQGLV